MRSSFTRSRALTAALLVGVSSSAAAQIGVTAPAVPGTYAITNARIVPAAGPTIERGTIVIRDGLIAAVGAAVNAPPDARVIDGTGLSVYPGFIDALSNVGLPQRRPTGGAGGGGGGGNPFAQPAAPAMEAPNSDNPAGLQPELRMLDVLEFQGDVLDAPRSAGITTILASPREGIFQGQSALVNLAGSSVQDMVVRSPIALHVGFTPVRGGYPGSLMGVFAALRQTLLDAQRYRDLQAAYARNPRGMRRPDNDPSLAALQPVLSREMPVIMTANSQREIERALDLAAEFGLRAMIAGGEEAWKVADRLKKENVPVIATLNFPRPAAQQSEDADPEPIRLLQSRVDIPRNPGKLATAGIKVAFTSGGVSMNEMLNNIRAAVNVGMSREAALRALTMTPADLFGVSDRIGSIEVGKIANLTITRGDVFDRSSRITNVFIDGRQFAVRAPAGDAGGAASAASGQWTITATFSEGDRTITLNLRQEGEQLRGNIQGALGSGEITNGSLVNNELKFTVPVTLRETSEEANFTGTLTGDVMRGSIQVIGHPNGTFVGTRPNRGQQPGGQRPPGQRPPAPTKT